MKYTKTFVTLALASVMALGGIANADTWTGAGADDKWETAANWAGGVVPLNAGLGNTFLNSGDIVFDADTWTFLSNQFDVDGTTLIGLRNPTEYRGVIRILSNENTNAVPGGGGPLGTASITFDQGAGNLVLNANATTIIGGQVGGVTTLNVLSGILNVGNDFLVAPRADSEGFVNLEGGTLIVARDGFQIGGTAGGIGTMTISGGEFLTRTFGRIGPLGTLNIIGASATQIGVGSSGSGDGDFLLDGTLSCQVDAAAGITPIFVDAVDTAAAVGTLSAGSILDLSFVGAPASGTTTYTIVEVEGAPLTDNGLALSAATSSDWSFAVDNSGPNGLLTATFTGSGGPVVKGDVNLDGGVTFLDIAPFITVLSSNGFQAEADCDCDGDVDFLDIQPFINILAGL